jgi:hypothetical protein
MFSVVKVRAGLARDDYRDPGPYKHPPGTVARKVDDTPTVAPHRHGALSPKGREIELAVVKPRPRHRGQL